MYKTWMMSVISLFMVLQLNGQYEFSGKVTDEEGNALIGANVSFTDNYLGTVTDKSGNFVFQNIQGGAYTVKVSYVGYKSLTRPVVIEEDLSLSFSLERTPYLVEEVIVRGVRAGQNDPVTSTIVNREEIEERNIIRDIPLLNFLTVND
ncbi:MAG: carboxypeptidase-like regulatory domain-containing protein, partial [Bacteroidota bacterium]